MSIKRVLFFIFILISFSYALNISKYIYPNESLDQVYSDNFTFGDINYSLYYYEQTPILLANGDNVISDQEQLYNILASYYRQKYFITEDEKNEIISLINAYNYSRNDGQRFKGKEEYACREALFFKVKDCYDEDSCLETSKLVCAGYANAIGCNNYMTVYPDVYSFGTASYGTDYVLGEMIYSLNNISLDNLGNVIDTLKRDVDQLDDYAYTIQHIPFRFPNIGESCNSCMAICPDIQFNNSALYDLVDLINDIYSRSKGISSFDSFYGNVSSQTSDRLLFYNVSAYLDMQNNTYHSLLDRENSLVDKVNYIDSIMYDSKISRTLSYINSTKESILVKLENRDTSVNEDIEEYNRLLNVLEMSVNYDSELYNNSTLLRDELLLKLSRLKKVKDVSSIEEEFNKLATSLKPGLDKDDYETLYTRLKNLSSQLPEISSSQTPFYTKTLLKNIGSLTSYLGLNKQSFNNNLSLYSLLSIAPSLFFALFVSLLLLSYSSKKWTKISSIALIAIAFIIPLFGFIMLDSYSKSVSLDEAISVLKTSDSVAISVVYDNKGVKDSANQCANQIKEFLVSNNKSVSINSYSKEEFDNVPLSSEFNIVLEEGNPGIDIYLYNVNEIIFYNNDFTSCSLLRTIKEGFDG